MSARQFAQERIRPVAMDREWIEDPCKRFPWDLVEEASKRGFRTLTVPEEYGGVGASTLTACLVAEEFGAADVGFTISFNHCWRDIKLVEGVGTKEQKEWFFPSFVKDDRYITSVAMTEPAHGSDVSIPYQEARLDTRANLEEGKWVINGRKRFVSNGNLARLLFLMAATDSSKPLTQGSSLFMVPREETQGIEIEEIYDKIGTRLLNNAELIFNNSKIDKKNLLGNVNQGFQVMSHCFRSQDPLRSAISVGVARSAYETALTHATQRIQGGRPIINHQAVGMKLARMCMILETARTTIWRSAWGVDNPSHFDRKLGHMANYYAVTGSFEVCKMAVEILALNGLLMNLPAQKYLRDSTMMLAAGTPIDNILIRIQNLLKEENSRS